MGGSVPSLLDLPDDVICVLLRYLDATSLYLLGRTCTHLDELIRNYFTIWRRIDARRSPNDEDKLLYCLDRCYDDNNTWTHTFLISRDDRTEISLPCDFFTRLNAFNKITILALENQKFDGSKNNAKSFPQGLIEFSLRRSSVTNTQEFFKGSGDHFKQLRVLILDECDWLRSSAFMPISKYGSLEILSVYMCKNLTDSIAYLSLARQGFKALKIFDARLSILGTALIRAIYKLPSLLAIYLQNFDLSYKLDYYKRKYEVARGAPRRNLFRRNEDFDFEDLNRDEENGLHDHTASLDDNGLVDYISVHSIDKNVAMPESILYIDPYNKCTCNFDKKQFNSVGPPPDPPTDNNHDDPPTRNLLNEIKHLSSLIDQNQGRSFSYHRPQSPGTTTIIHLPYSGNNENVIVMDLSNLRRRRAQNDEPPAKRLRTDESAAGPSGLNRNNGNDSENEEESGVHRPPTPHPDIVFEDHVRQASVRIFFRDSPVVQIEHISEIHKTIKVPLKRLSLRGYKKITNMTLSYIKDLELELLDLTYTSVSVEAIEDYLKSHPLCRVVHQRFCTCPINLHF